MLFDDRRVLADTFVMLVLEDRAGHPLIDLSMTSWNCDVEMTGVVDRAAASTTPVVDNGWQGASTPIFPSQRL